MSNPNDAKGKRWERDATKAYEDHHLTVYRPNQYGWQDQGDRHLPPFLLQMKNYADIATGLRLGVAGAIKQAAVAGLQYPVVLIKRRGKPAAQGYAVMTIDDHAALVRELIDLRTRKDPQ